MHQLKSIILIFTILLCGVSSFSQTYYAQAIGCSNGLRMLKSTEDQSKEINYVSDHISDIQIFRSTNNIYLNWYVCDDTSQCCFMITKYVNNQECGGWVVLNIPSKVEYPLLYSVIDKNGISHTTMYKFFRMTNDGTNKFIATIIVPFPEDD